MLSLIAQPLEPFAAILEDGDRRTRFDLPDSTPETRAELVRWLAPQLTAGQRLRLAPLEYAFGAEPFRLTSGLRMVGAGPETVLTSTQENQANACGFEIAGRGIRLADMSLVWKSKDIATRGGQTLGVANRTNPGNTEARFTRLRLTSFGGAAVYYWGGGKGHRATFVECALEAGRWAGCIGAGSGDDSAILEFERSTLTANFARWGGAGGDMGGPPTNTAGWVSRGGRATFTDCTADVTGFPGTGQPNDPNGPPFALAVCWTASSLGDRTYPKWPYAWPYLRLVRCKANTVANGAGQAFDVQQYAGTVDAIDCLGSGPDGRLLTDGKIGPLPAAK